MKQVMSIVCFALLLLLVASSAVTKAEVDVDKYSLWMGGHYTDFKDYTKKVGEYRLFSDNVFPEFKFNQFSRRGNSVFTIDGHYFDYENVVGRVRSIVGDRFKGNFQYRSLTKQRQYDLLSNMEVREAAPPQGKMITHELTDLGADYSTHRQEITSDVNFLVSRQNNIRMIAAHRYIRETGDKQSVSNNHCFSCHLTSSPVKVEQQTHEFETGVQAEASKYDFGYLFGYRKFSSQAPDAYGPYDPALNPVNGTAGPEFASRLIYSDTTLPVNVLPETEKMSHKVNLKGDLGSGRIAAAFFYNKTENKKNNYAGTELESKSYGGNINYTVPLNRHMRLVAKAVGKRIKNNDPFIDLPLFRGTRPDSVWVNFDYYRYSSLDRKIINSSAEVIDRVSSKLMLSLLAGYDYTLRYDYPEFEADYATKKVTGQLKARYSEGMKYTVRGNYRYEKTTDPFTSGRGLFENSGRDVLEPLRPGFGFIFYFQREALRYQNITTVPTDRHEVDINADIRGSKRVNLTLGFKTVIDKNNDLDSLDVKHFSMKPNVSLTMMPDPRWTMVTGYTYDYAKSRGPVAVALFDG